MKILSTVVVILLGLAISGCATYNSKKCNAFQADIKNLQERVGALESGRVAGDIVSSDVSISGRNAISREPLTNKDIQTALKNAGFYNGPIDGKIGRNTKKAIEDFQAANNLKVDGAAGSKTKGLLIKYLNQ